MRMWVLESGYGNIRTTVWDGGSKYRNVGIGVFVWELHTCKKCWYGNVGTRV